MKLDKQDQEFRNPKLFYPDPKNVVLDRILIHLFLLLRCDGKRPVVRGRVKKEFEKVEHHLRTLAKRDGVTGFDEHFEIAQAWLESDIFDLVNRGKVKQAMASLRPLHLDAHKIRVARFCRDYSHADALYAMLFYGERQVVADLKGYLNEGRDAAGRYDGKTNLDLETLTVLKLVEEMKEPYHLRDSEVAEPPVCIGQSRLLCDDVQRILAYRHEVPRPVMVDYLKTLFGLHMAFYTLRLGRQLAGWIRDQRPHPVCQECPVHGALTEPFAGCPYQQHFTVDMGGDFTSRMAQLAQESAASEYSSRLPELVKALFTMNQLLRYARDNTHLGVGDDPWQVLTFLENPGVEFNAQFQVLLNMLRSRAEEKDEEISPELEAIFKATDLTAFERFVEVVTHVRQKHHVGYLWQDLDRLFQKNTESGSLVQGRARRNPRRWQLGGRLLEVLVQLAVLDYRDEDGRKTYFSKPILVDEFLRWLEARYGFVVGIPRTEHVRAPVTVEEHRAYRENVQALKDRLREIGFYDDLSDAFNAQTLRPRYEIKMEEAV